MSHICQIDGRRLEQGSFWALAKEERFENKELLEKLSMTFASSTKGQFSQSSCVPTCPPVCLLWHNCGCFYCDSLALHGETEVKERKISSRKVKDLKVLDAKVAQNLCTSSIGLDHFSHSSSLLLM